MLLCVSFVMMAGFMLPFGHALDKQPHPKAIRRVLSKEQRMVQWQTLAIDCVGKRCVPVLPTDELDQTVSPELPFSETRRPPVDFAPIRLLGRAIDVQRETKHAQTVAGEGKLAALLKRGRLPCYPCRGTLPMQSALEPQYPLRTDGNQPLLLDVYNPDPIEELQPVVS